MICEVFSIHAAISGMPNGTTWHGDLDLSLASSDEGRLELVYRLLNRVDESDHERLEAMGYMLPSLSMGDFVTLHLDVMGEHGPVTQPRTWMVASVGFVEVTGNRDMLPLR